MDSLEQDNDQGAMSLYENLDASNKLGHHNVIPGSGVLHTHLRTCWPTHRRQRSSTKNSARR